MYTIILLIRVPENSERTVVQWIQVLSVRHSGYLIVVPLEEASLHCWMEAREDLVLADTVDIGRVRVRTRVTRVGRTAHMVVTVFGHLGNK